MNLSKIASQVIFSHKICPKSRRMYEIIRNKNANNFDYLYHLTTDDDDLPGIKTQMFTLEMYVFVENDASMFPVLDAMMSDIT